MFTAIKWVEKDGKLFYMDNTVFKDSYAQELIKNIPYGPCLMSHNTIRKYYDIVGGTDYKVQDFWDVKKFPEELKTKLEHNEFSILWEYMCKHDLRYIICNAPEEYKEKAWKLLVDKDIDKDDFSLIIVYADDTNGYAEKAWELLMDSECSTAELCYLMSHTINKYLEMAWQVFLCGGFKGIDACYLIAFAPFEYKELAWEALMRVGYTATDLRYLTKVYYVPKEYKVRARNLLSKGGIKNK